MSSHPPGTSAPTDSNASSKVAKATPKQPPGVETAKLAQSAAKNSGAQQSVATTNGPALAPQGTAAQDGVGATKNNVGASPDGVFSSAQSSVGAAAQNKAGKTEAVTPVSDTVRLQQQQQLQQQRLTMDDAHDATRNNATTDSGIQTSTVQARKKSSFQITNVVTSKDSESKDLDATDDADDANTDDLSSDVLETSSRLTDNRLSSTDTLHSPLPDTVVSGHGVASQSDITVTLSKTATTAASLVTSTPGKDAQSRFKIVKIESKGHLKRGRWVCFDFADPHGSTVAAAKSDVSAVSGGTGVATPDPIYYFPNVDVHHAKSPFAPAAIVYNEGHPVLERNPLDSPHFHNQTRFFRDDDWETVRTMVAAATGGGQEAGLRSRGPPEAGRRGESGAMPPLLQSLSRVESGLAGVVSASELGESYPLAEQLGMLSPRIGPDFFSMLSAKRGSQGSPLFAAIVAGASPGAGAVVAVGNSDESSNSNVAIDNKIEQAMDLVKSHLMFAVREEVEILKEQIKELMLKNQQLEYENAILRADATPETLAKLQAAVPL